MERPLTIPTAPLEHPAMDFARLRQEGLEYIRRLAGEVWTDHNTHDPGITILEQLCYVLTDLSYRIDYDLQDLLASGGEEDPYHALYSPAEVLMTNPVTLTDLRKVIIDVEGVKNAWVEPVETPEPAVFYDPADQTLYLEEAAHREVVPLRGVYRVLVEADGSVPGELLPGSVSRRLHACRNLCEDFEHPVVLRPQPIIVEAKVEIGEVEDPDALLAAIYDALARCISPSLRFYTLSEMLARGKRIDEVMDGPALDHGFIDTEELEGFERKTALRTSDLIRVIMDVEGVRAVRSISLTTAGDRTDAWFLELDWELDYTPVLDANQSRISLVRGHVVAASDPGAVKAIFEGLQHAAHYEPLPVSQRDIILAKGRDRQVDHYQSIQHHFPDVYGIGALGLPASASDQRQAQARQLKAYLLFFDQLLANYFAQLAHAKDLFSFRYEETRTYFSQVLSTAPGVEAIIQGDLEVNGAPSTHADRLQVMTDETAPPARRQRFLNHLLARFCEQFTDYSLLTYAQMAPEKLVADTCAFLRDYPDIGAGRGRAFNYTEPAWDTDNVSGLVKRISRLLGIKNVTRRNLAEIDQDDAGGFHMVEHLLLRPRAADQEQWAQADRALGQPYAFLANPLRTDPYSAQLSFVFPDWIERFKDEGFRTFIWKTLRDETPAHLSIHLHWLGTTEMGAFEAAHKDWLAGLQG